MSTQPLPIQLKGAQENNLKNIDLSIEPGRLTVITGLSGTGKSTLLFDVLHAEGQRRYVETFSPYVRQFMESLPRPKVESMLYARPSIAVEQKNTIRNSRSTVGTMTELCDYFKVWFPQVASLHDPDNNGKIIKEETASAQAKCCITELLNKDIILGFRIECGSLKADDFLHFLLAAGYSRILVKRKYQRIEDVLKTSWEEPFAFVVVDKIKAIPKNKIRIAEAVTLCLELGKGQAEARTPSGKICKSFYQGLRSSVSGKAYSSLGQNSFSFNSPLGACPKCRGFGRVIEINPALVISDPSLSLSQGVIKPFEGKVYGHCLNDLLDACPEQGIDPHKPWQKLSAQQKSFIWNGDPQHVEGDNLWYGIHSFFGWLEKKTYKMHIRVFLSKYRDYFCCPDCNGTRFKKEPQLWKWKNHSLPELYAMPISELLDLMNSVGLCNDPKTDLPVESIRTRLGYLRDVGLGYLSLDRTSRSLSGGETQRINLTACLGAGLTDTLFALDEPTIGLHHQDIGRLIEILKSLASAGNFVCVVEHDEQVIRAADRVIEMGAQPGASGGQIVFNGSVPKLLQSADTETGKWLTENKFSSLPRNKKPKLKDSHFIKIKDAHIHNLQNFDAEIPLGKLTCISGLSGSGKSTLLEDLIYKELSQGSPKGWVQSTLNFSEIVMIDQETIAKSPRSNPVLFADAWSPIKEAFGRTEQAKAAGFNASDFSFNSGQGRCDSCMGLGYENVEMQFLPDISVPCPICQGNRFKDELLEIRFGGLNVSETLNLTITEAQERYSQLPKTHRKLTLLKELGLGYLKLGQPLNTLSGGESQRLKLAKFMGPLQKENRSALILLDEPTTGLHLADVQRLIDCLRQVVSRGHSLLVIEHHLSVLLQSDWIVELGPGAGKLGGNIIASGTPTSFHRLNTPTGRLFKGYQKKNNPSRNGPSSRVKKSNKSYFRKSSLEIIGAQENNLKDLSLAIPSNQFVVITGPSGSGKSSLAFDVVFAEGQRRFMESMSSYARQFVEQVGRPKVDLIRGISPTVAIEQRVTRGSRKSTVGSITEIAQYLRLLYARLGTQCSPRNGTPLVSSTPQEICRKLARKIKGVKGAQLLFPLVTNRKGHHKPLINWAKTQGFELVRCDGKLLSTQSFDGLDRYKLHDIELVLETWEKPPKSTVLQGSVQYALKMGKGRCLLLLPSGETSWFSIHNSDPETGEAYPDLEPLLLSWNSPKGWCTSCRGYGRIYDWMKDDLPANGQWWSIEDGDVCPTCSGDRLNPVGRNVFLFSQNRQSYSLPQLLALPPVEIELFLKNLKINPQLNAIRDAILPEVFERLNFMSNVGLEYLSLNRETASLSGGESQRIRLAGQLGSNLSGVLYVLDEPSIGLHPSDNQKLIDSLRSLQKKGNSLLVVEHDQETILQADCIIEIGPNAGEHGGHIVEMGKPAAVAENGLSGTGKYLSLGISHPIRGNWRKLAPFRKNKEKAYVELSKVTFRNLKNLCIRIPIGCLTVCCGVSGAGKSSLVRGPLFQGIKQSIRESTDIIKSDNYLLKNGNLFSKAIEVSQAPIGKTSRSNPATYLGVWTRIRDLISTLPEAKARGFSPSDFSFNVKGGRCETCKGAGRIKLEMNFLPDSFIECQECQGKRYKDEVLNLQWHGKNIAEILDMTFDDAVEFFSFDEVLRKTFLLMVQTGLGYLKLGQTSPTLSGGEAQRLKLASELANGIEIQGKKHKKLKKNFYVLEEPTIGLHPQDSEKLILLLHQLVDEGHTVVVIEHDVDLIAEADCLIELGPRGGADGGKLLHQGTVPSLLKKNSSPTAKFLARVVNAV
ncbi:MAG: excinuclease ABC subunit A [Opitutae bacterium]|nr:excinuclease ABC subunit A [Opitutae bacterium]